jgi:hypothetical protein
MGIDIVEAVVEGFTIHCLMLIVVGVHVGE